MNPLTRWPALPYVLPFAVFMVLLAVLPMTGIAPLADQVVRLVVVGGVVVLVSRPVLDFSVRHWLGTLVVGVGVFLIWITPDLLVEGYRDFWLFKNSLLGEGGSSFAEAGRGDTATMVLRSIRAAILVPIVEELFWRGWLPRWIVNPDFQKVALGGYTRAAFWITALLFASEHGIYWDVGLVAGLIYNGWMWKTKSLGDCIAAHAITNACLSAYVVMTGEWQYW
jgi:CAAX prenyl protease-like protein